MDNILTFTIDSKEPIQLDVFNRSLKSFKKEFDSITQSSSELYIKEIRKGSIEIDLLAVAGMLTTVLPLFEKANVIGQFMDYMNRTAKWLSGASKKPTENSYTMEEIRNFKDIFSPIASSKSEEANIRLSAQGCEQIHLSSKQAKAIAEFPEHILVLADKAPPDEPEMQTYNKVLFYWYQACFDENRLNTGNRGTIQAIDQKPKKVIFADDASDTKREMITSHPDTGVDWQKVGYVVDVEVMRKDSDIVAYKILKNYMSDAIF